VAAYRSVWLAAQRPQLMGTRCTQTALHCTELNCASARHVARVAAGDACGRRVERWPAVRSLLYSVAGAARAVPTCRRVRAIPPSASASRSVQITVAFLCPRDSHGLSPRNPLRVATRNAVRHEFPAVRASVRARRGAIGPAWLDIWKKYISSMTFPAGLEEDKGSVADAKAHCLRREGK
jgi:hypothetical protein